MCQPVGHDLEKRKDNHTLPPGGRERRKKMPTDDSVTWRAVVDWIIRAALGLTLILVAEGRRDLNTIRTDVGEMKVDVAVVTATVATNVRDIGSVKRVDVALMGLLNELTANVATLTERIAQTASGR